MSTSRMTSTGAQATSPDGAWRARAGTTFTCAKRPATGTRGMVVTNHPLATAAGLEMLAAGGNAIDAAIASLFALTIVEPMMVGILGGGMAHIRLAGGHHTVVDRLSTCPDATTPTLYKPVSLTDDANLDAEGRANMLGSRSVAVPGTLTAWCQTLARYGTLSLADVVEPAIRHGRRGFTVTPFLADCIGDTAADLALDAEIASVSLPGGTPLRAGDRIVQGDAAETLSTIARQGAGVLHGGALGNPVADHFAKSGSLISRNDLEARYGRYGVCYLDDVYVRQRARWLFERMDAQFYYTVAAGVGWIGDELHYLRPRT